MNEYNSTITPQGIIIDNLDNLPLVRQIRFIPLISKVIMCFKSYEDLETHVSLFRNGKANENLHVPRINYEGRQLSARIINEVILGLDRIDALPDDAKNEIWRCLMTFGIQNHAELLVQEDSDDDELIPRHNQRF